VALDERERTMLLMVVDGRQPNYSEGVTIAELADIMIEYGGYTALNMDGGGSTTLVIEGEDGEPLILNSPIHHHIPGQERPVGNHLGIYAQRN
jgi:exopolysaccharide biosynthesis protein